MDATTGNSSLALIQASGTVGLIAAAGLVLMPHLWSQVRSVLVLGFVMSGMVATLYLVSLAIVMAIVGNHLGGLILLVTAVAVEPTALSIALITGYKVARTKQRWRDALDNNNTFQHEGGEHESDIDN